MPCCNAVWSTDLKNNNLKIIGISFHIYWLGMSLYLYPSALRPAARIFRRGGGGAYLKNRDQLLIIVGRICHVASEDIRAECLTNEPTKIGNIFLCSLIFEIGILVSRMMSSWNSQEIFGQYCKRF